MSLKTHGPSLWRSRRPSSTPHVAARFREEAAVVVVRDDDGEKGAGGTQTGIHCNERTSLASASTKMSLGSPA